MVVVLVRTVIVRAGNGHERQGSLQIGGDGLIGIGFRGRQRRDALGGEPSMQSRSDAGRDQNLHVVQGVRFVGWSLVKGLFERQLQQSLARNLLLVNVVNPELAAFTGVVGDRAAILAGNCDFHVTASVKTCETFNTWDA